MDTVRADHLGCYGYEGNESTPALDALAAGSILFEAASATACWTKPSVPSFLTGTYPVQHGVYQGSSKDEAGSYSDVLPESAVTLAEVFSENGYATGAFIKNAQLRRGLGFEQGFDTYEDQAGDAREIRWKGFDWLDDRNPEKPFFLYLHFLDAHWPYDIPDEYAGRFTEVEKTDFIRKRDWRALRDDINHGEKQLEPDQYDALIALYDGSIRYIDDQLALLFRKLQREGLTDDTVICVISDHGEEFMEHGRIGHGHGLYEGLLHVPWILSVPGMEARRITQPCSLVNVYSTLLAAAGLGAGGGLDLTDEELARRPVFAEHLEPGSYSQSLREATDKVLMRVRVSPREHTPRLPLESIGSGESYEAEVVYTPAGGLRATKLEWSDEPPSERLEVKGVVAKLTRDSLIVNGLTVRISPSTVLYGELLDGAGQRRELRNGLLVKVRGILDDDGLLVPVKIKLYEDGAQVEREIRGVVTGIDPPGRMSIGGIWIAVDDQTEIETREGSRGPRMSRSDVLDFLAGQRESSQTEPTLQYTIYDLAEDPDEHAPNTSQRTVESELHATLQSIAWTLAKARVWSEDDSVTLSAEDLESLRAIGYAE